MLTTKARGVVLELEFGVACVARGGVVGFVYGDMAPYDVILDNGRRLLRVQTKKSTLRENGRWLMNARPRIDGRAIPYGEGALDCIATVAGEHWYFFFDVTLLPTSVTIYPGDPTCPHDKLRDAWELLGLPKVTTALV